MGDFLLVQIHPVDSQKVLLFHCPCRGFATDMRFPSSGPGGSAELSWQSCPSALETVEGILSPWSFISVSSRKVLDNQASGKGRISISQLCDPVAKVH